MNYKKNIYHFIGLFLFAISPVCSDEICSPNFNCYANGDLLYWRTFQDNSSCSCGLKNQNKWDLGYRLGLEFDSPCCWNIETTWTHFQTKSSHHHERNNSKIHYECLDILFGHHYRINSCLSLKLAVGLRGAMIEHHLRGHDANEQICSLGNTLIVTDIDVKEKFQGVGPQFHVNAHWGFGCGFSLFANLGFSVLYGNFKIKGHRIETFIDPSEECTCNENCRSNICEGAADAAIGIQWEKNVCRDLLLSLKLAWEHHRYFRFHRASNNGDLSFDGLSFSAQISF